jgi:hypothetical protein
MPKLIRKRLLAGSRFSLELLKTELLQLVPMVARERQSLAVL